MQIREENQTFAEEDVLLLDGLLDLDHHVGLAPHVTGFADNFGTGILVLFVREAGTGASLGFDQYIVAGFAQRLDCGWGNADAGFVVLDLFGNADDHGLPPYSGI